MKWFKHHTSLSQDVKIKRLIRAYGVEGYGLYLYILELIVRRLEKESPLPDLEESSADIAADTNMDVVKVEQIMWFCIEQGLFEQDELTGRLVAHKVYKFLQASETRSSEIRAMIKAYTESQITPIPLKREASQTVSDNCEEQNRTEQNRTEKRGVNLVEIGNHFSVTDSQWSRFLDDYYESDLRRLVETMNDWIDAKKGGRSPYKDYAAALRNWIKKAGIEKRLKETESPLERYKREAAE